MKIEKYVVGMIGTNCYLVINEETKDTVMVDPGAYPTKLKNAVKEQGLKLKAVLLTHAHFDHIMGLSDVMEDIKIPVYVEEADLPMMMDGESNLSSGYMRGGYQFADAVPVRDGQQLQIAGFQFRVIHTPGHTPGGCCYYFPYEDVIFTGDSLFCGSIGRTDFKGGSMSDLVRTVKEKIMTLPEHTEVYPGHNDTTTIENERMYNPYL